MNAQNDLDRRLAAAFQDGPSRAPEGSIDNAVAYAHAHARRRDPLALLRKDPMNTQSSRFAVAQPLPLLALLAVILTAGVGATAGGLFNERPVVAPPPATPSPIASAPASPAPSASPASLVMTVDLIEQVGADATIDITDLSGRLVRAQSGVPGDGASVASGAVVATGLAASPATVILTWSGLPCDTTHALTIDSDGLGMVIRRPACEGDAMGVDHVLQLTFDGPVDPARVNVKIETVGS